VQTCINNRQCFTVCTLYRHFYYRFLCWSAVKNLLSLSLSLSHPSIGTQMSTQRKLGSKQAHRVIYYPVSGVSQCGSVSGCGLVKRRSAPTYGKRWRIRDVFAYYTCTARYTNPHGLPVSVEESVPRAWCPVPYRRKQLNTTVTRRSVMWAVRRGSLVIKSLVSSTYRPGRQAGGPRRAGRVPGDNDDTTSRRSVGRCVYVARCRCIHDSATVYIGVSTSQHKHSKCASSSRVDGCGRQPASSKASRTTNSLRRSCTSRTVVRVRQHYSRSPDEVLPVIRLLPTNCATARKHVRLVWGCGTCGTQAIAHISGRAAWQRSSD